MSNTALPVEYIPMSVENLKAGDTFPDVVYRLRESSHDKTVGGLIDSLGNRKPDAADFPLLLPSEHWGLARVLCQKFGRLNEVAVGGAAWEIFELAEVGRTLRSTAKIIGTSSKRGFAFCDALHETYDDASGKLLLRCRDRMILTHDCVKPFFVEPEPVRPQLPENLLYDNHHIVYHRYPWDPSLWDNNIHVDEYAQSCGFARGLPEFVTYMDWIYHTARQAGWPVDRPFSVKLQKVLPMYLGDTARLVAWTDRDMLQVRILKEGAERVVARLSELAPAEQAGERAEVGEGVA